MKNLLFAIFMSITLISQAQTPVAPAGTGTENDPYQITTLNNLYWMSVTPTSWDKYFEQTDNIDATSTATWNSGAGWDPIGYVNGESDYLAFTGYYNGNNWLIGDLYINRPTELAVGFFSIIENAHISHMGIYNASTDITGGEVTGMLAGFNLSSTIIDCFGVGHIYGVSDLGGLIGRNETGTEYLYDCSFDGVVVGTGDNIGGLIGKNKGTVRNCNTFASITGTSNLGALIGENNGDFAVVDSCQAGGAIYVIGNEPSVNAGGLIGENKEGTVVSYCFSHTQIEGNENCANLGGLVGLNDNGSIINYCFSTYFVVGGGNLGGVVGSNSYSIISNCYSRSNVTGTQNNVGGVVGRNTGTVEKSYGTGVVTSSGGCFGGVAGSNEDGGEVFACFWDTQTSGVVEGCGYNGGGTLDIVGKTTVEMKTQTTFTNAGWDFYGESANGTYDNWFITQYTNDGYPCFKWYTDFVGIRETSNDKNTFSVFPNPASDIIFVTVFSGETEITKLSIYTITGSLLYSAPHYQSNEPIDISNLKTGSYFIELKSAESKSTIKLIVNR